MPFHKQQTQKSSSPMPAITKALIKANESLSRVINGLHQQLSGDLISEDLRQVLSELAEITGEGQITPNEVLNNIFQHFCVGK